VISFVTLVKKRGSHGRHGGSGNKALILLPFQQFYLQIIKIDLE